MSHSNNCLFTQFKILQASSLELSLLGSFSGLSWHGKVLVETWYFCYLWPVISSLWKTSMDWFAGVWARKKCPRLLEPWYQINTRTFLLSSAHSLEQIILLTQIQDMEKLIALLIWRVAIAKVWLSGKGKGHGLPSYSLPSLVVFP